MKVTLKDINDLHDCIRVAEDEGQLECAEFHRLNEVLDDMTQQIVARDHAEQERLRQQDFPGDPGTPKGPLSDRIARDYDLSMQDFRKPDPDLEMPMADEPLFKDHPICMHELHVTLYTNTGDLSEHLVEAIVARAKDLLRWAAEDIQKENTILNHPLIKAHVSE